MAEVHEGKEAVLETGAEAPVVATGAEAPVVGALFKVIVKHHTNGEKPQEAGYYVAAYSMEEAVAIVGQMYGSGSVLGGYRKGEILISPIYRVLEAQ